MKFGRDQLQKAKNSTDVGLFFTLHFWERKSKIILTIKLIEEGVLKCLK